MPVKEALLGLIGARPGHGYDLKSRYDTLLDPSRSLQEAQVYATLTRLERDGLIEVTAVGQDGGPPRRTFALTPGGRRELDRWLDEPVAPVVHLQADLYTKAVLTGLTGKSVGSFLDRQRHAHMVRMRELTRLRQSPDSVTSSLAEFALFHLEADLRWLELAANRADQFAEPTTTNLEPHDD